MGNDSKLERMPALFIGHGNPMNALLTNPFTERWAGIGAALPKPKAIVSVSAHWYIEDAAVTVSTAPRTIHDFGGFPRELYQLQYPAPGDPDLAARIEKLLAPTPLRRDQHWASTMAPGKFCFTSIHRPTFLWPTQYRRNTATFLPLRGREALGAVARRRHSHTGER